MARLHSFSRSRKCYSQKDNNGDMETDGWSQVMEIEWSGF
jgi:hypothetical protein